jgi:hypothetical protein
MEVQTDIQIKAAHTMIYLFKDSACRPLTLTYVMSFFWRLDKFSFSTSSAL